jgi:hypothetical protein
MHTPTVHMSSINLHPHYLSETPTLPRNLTHTTSILLLGHTGEGCRAETAHGDIRCGVPVRPSQTGLFLRG